MGVSISDICNFNPIPYVKRYTVTFYTLSFFPQFGRMRFAEIRNVSRELPHILIWLVTLPFPKHDKFNFYSILEFPYLEVMLYHHTLPYPMLPVMFPILGR